MSVPSWDCIYKSATTEIFSFSPNFPPYISSHILHSQSHITSSKTKCSKLFIFSCNFSLVLSSYVSFCITQSKSLLPSSHIFVAGFLSYKLRPSLNRFFEHSFFVSLEIFAHSMWLWWCLYMSHKFSNLFTLMMSFEWLSTRCSQKASWMWTCEKLWWLSHSRYLSAPLTPHLS